MLQEMQSGVSVLSGQNGRDLPRAGDLPFADAETYFLLRHSPAAFIPAQACSLPFTRQK